MQRRLAFMPLFLTIAALTFSAGCLDLTQFLNDGGGFSFVGPPTETPDNEADAPAAGGATFNLAPNAVITVDVDRGIAPLTVNFSSAESRDDGLIVSREWSFGDGTTSQEVSPIKIYQTTGEFLVSLVVTDDAGLQDTDTQLIIVTEAPIPRIVPDRTTAPSAPATFNFDGSTSSDSDGEIVRFEWDFGDGSTALGPTVQHTYARPGSYRVELSVTDDDGVEASTLIVVEVGIAVPTLVFRTPPSDARNVAIPKDSPVWVQIEFDVEIGVPRFLSAGLDRDFDICDAQTRVYDVSTLAETAAILGHRDRVRDVEYSPDGTLLLTAGDDGELRIVDAETGDLSLRFVDTGSAVNSAAWSPDGSVIAAARADGAVTLRNSVTGAVLRTLSGLTLAARSVAFSSDGAQVVAGGNDDVAIIWDVLSGGQLLTLDGHTGDVTSVDFVNNRVLTASQDGTARIWDADVASPTAGGELLRFSLHAAPVFAAAFSPDGALVATGGADDLVRLWRATNGVELRQFSGHVNDVVSVAFAPDGARLASGSRDASARVFDVATADVLGRVEPCDSAIASVAFSPNGLQLAAGVAAANATQLDAEEEQGNDLNLTTPQPLRIDRPDVEPGEYFLYSEVNTDRTAPLRRYSPTVVQVVAPAPAFVTNPTDPDAPPPPPVALLGDQATVVAAPTPVRQIFDLGPVAAGDRIELALVSQPGFDTFYRETQFPESAAFTSQANIASESDGFYSIMLLDAEERVLAWYQQDEDINVLFSPATRIVFGDSTSNLYVATDTGSSFAARLERNFGLVERQQRVFLNFGAGDAIIIGDNQAQTFDSLSDQLQAIGYTADEVANEILPTLVSRVRTLFSLYDVVIQTSNGALNDPPDAGAPPAPPFQEVFFGGVYTVNFSAESPPPIDIGAVDFVDPRNDTLTGAAAVGVGGILQRVGQLDTTSMGLLLGNATAHQVGLLLGLRRTEGTTNDIMDIERLWLAADNIIETNTPIFTTGDLRGIEQFSERPAEGVPFVEAIGTQDADLLLLSVVGPAQP